jgi:hypothetical protein
MYRPKMTFYALLRSCIGLLVCVLVFSYQKAELNAIGGGILSFVVSVSHIGPLRQSQVLLNVTYNVFLPASVLHSC